MPGCFTGITGLTIADDGTITIPAGTAAGTYQITYQICEDLNPTNCDTAIATVQIDAATILAEDDDLSAVPVSSVAGGTAGNIYADNGSGTDTLNGTATGIVGLTTIAVTDVGGLTGVTIADNGDVVVPPNTPAGTYTVTYELCQDLNPTNCDTAAVTVVVDPSPIVAVDDPLPAVNSFLGGTTPSVLGNDLLNGVVLNPAAITLTPGTAPAPAVGSITMNPDGTITVAAGTTAGTYIYPYEICEVLNPANCSTADATVTVDAPSLTAVDDTPPAIISALGGTTPSVLGNDLLNGVILDPTDVVLTPGTAPTPTAGSITMNPDGTITVALGTTAGTYAYTYEICEVVNPANCATAEATVVVDPSVLLAVDDTPAPLPAALGGTTPSVLGNDTLNGAAVDPTAVTLTPGTAPAPATGSIIMNPDGTITVAPNTTAGTYLYTYEICEVVNPANCATAQATIVVVPETATELVADVSEGNIPGTAVTISVLANDSDPLNVFDPATLTIVGTANPGDPLVVDGEGTWTVDLANSTITFTPEPGFFGNPTPIRYSLRDLAGNLLAAVSVVITYEQTAAFICSDVIGKVFDDINQNGAQDAGEAGISGARLTTVNGFVITTDQFGRYSIPCADVPRDIGSTFLLKLDPRSLPTGYRLTTENPRTVRLTQGTMRKMNFGAILSNVVRADLTDEAFDPKTGEITEGLDDGLKALVRSIARKPSVLRLSYFAKAEPLELSEDRLDLVEDRLRELWRGKGRYKLNLEKTVVSKD